MPLKTPRALVLAASVLALSAGTVATTFAQDATPPATPEAQAPAPDSGRALPLRMEVFFNLLDKNADGKIDADEAATFQKAIFDAVDANHDGTLSKDEFPRFAGMGGKPGPRDGMRMHDRDDRGPGDFRGWPGRPGGMMRDGQGPMMGPDGKGPRFDRDGKDGRPLRPTFESLDTNHDGTLSPDEFAAGAPKPPMPQQ